MQSLTSKLWEEVVSNPPKSYKEIFDFEKDYIGRVIANSDSVLDIGCSCGRFEREFSGMSKRFIGIDNDLEAISCARKNCGDVKGLELYVMDAENMNFADGEIDYALCSMTIVNFDLTKHGIFEETRRILKKGGRFIFSVYNEEAFHERLKIYSKLCSNFSYFSCGMFLFDSGVVSEQFSYSQIEELCRETGFRIDNYHKGEIFYLFDCVKE